MNEKKEIEYHRFEEEDVYDIVNPAYVVKKVEKSKDDKEGGKYRGCIISWNEKFAETTNFKPEQIDNGSCHKLFEGYRWQEDNKYVKVCKPDCDYYKMGTQRAEVLRNVWIKSKDKARNDIWHNVDIYIFPFVSKCSECNNVLNFFALHLLIDRGKEMNTIGNIEIKNEVSKSDVVKVEDVHDIRNPAFVVEQQEVGGGKILLVNDPFTKLTKFKKSDIKDSCHILFEGHQWQGKNNYVPVCRENCEFRMGETKEATVLRNIWIKSKLETEEIIRRKVDIYILPFVSDNKNYALHILIDKKGVHDNKYFEEKMLNRECKTTQTTVSTTAGA